MTRVVNRHREHFDVYIGRGTPFGNPFVIGVDGDRNEVFAKYEVYFDHKIKTDPVFREQVNRLKNQVLGCSCKPFACHGDIIVRYLDKE